MEKEKILFTSFPHKFLLFIIAFIYSQTAFSQCLNPDPIGNETQEFCKSDNSTVANLAASGGTIVWFDAITDGIQLNPSTPLINNTTYFADDLKDGSCSPNRLAVLVSIYGKLPTNVDVFVGKCAIDNPTIADLSATGVNIAWYDAQSGGNLFSFSDSLEDGTTYWVQQTENGCTSERLPTTVTMVNPPPPTVSQNQTFCSSTDPKISDLKANEANVVWYDFETSTEPLTINSPLVDGNDYWAANITFPCEGSIRTKTTVTIDIAPNSGTDGNYSECESSLVITNLFELLGGTPDNSGTWKGPSELSGGYLGTFDPTVNIEGSYTYTVASILEFCSNSSSTVNVEILKVPPPTTTQTSQTFCEISNPTIANLNVIGNGILWYDTEASTTPLDINDTLLNGEDYWATQTNANGCSSATRLMVTAIIISTPPPTTTQTSQTFHETDNPTIANLSATGNGVLWYDTETSTTPLDVDDTLINNDDYWATQTSESGCESPTRLMVTALIISTPPPTTTQTSQTFCEIDNPTIANLNVIGNGILWYDTEVSTTPLNPNDVLINGEDYWATQTNANGYSSAERLMVTALIISTPPPTTTQTSQTFCEIDNPIIANLSAIGNGVLWYDTETSTTPLNPEDTLINGKDYWASQTNVSGCESVTRLVVTASILSPPPPTTTQTSQTFCKVDNPTIANLSVMGQNIVWYDTESSFTPLNDDNELVNGKDYWASQTNDSGCESVTRLVVTAFITSPPPPTTTQTSQIFCEIDNPIVANLNATGNGVLWYDTEASITPLNIDDSLLNGEDYWATQTEASGCESKSRLMVSVNIVSTAPPTTSKENQTFCKIDNPTIANLSVMGQNIVWYESETSTTPLNNDDALVNGEDYWAVQNDESNCTSASRLLINVIVSNPEKATSTEINQKFCSVDNPTIANLQVNEDSILWFDTETSTTPLNETDTLVDGEDYWALNYNLSNGCQSISKLMITATILEVQSPTINNTSQVFCASDIPKISDLQEDESIVWYASESDTAPLKSTDLLINGLDYWAAQTGSNGCESSTRIAVSVTLTDAGTPVLIELGNQFCGNLNPTLSDLDLNVSPINSGVITWYDSYPNGNIINLSEFLKDGKTYYAFERDNDGCSSASPLAVTADLTACEQYDITIYDGFSPNGNGVNDYFKISNLRELYPNFRVEFYNRWGNLVYTSNSSKPDWNGRLNGNDELVPAGVYYFIIYFNKDDRKPIQRRLYLSR